MAKEKISGIYKITAKHNGKVYIGQSNDIYTRWRSHWKQVNRGDNDYLHNCMRKYGKDNFEYEIIEECNQDIINEREKYWIQHYDSYNNGLNLTLGGEGVKGKVFSYEEKEKMRNYAKNVGRSKPVLQIDTAGNIVNEWRSCKEIGKTTDMLSTNIHDCLKHKGGYRLAYGYIWLYKEEYLNDGLNLDLYLSKNRDTLCNRIYQIDKNNKKNVVKIWDDIHQIISENPNYKYSSIYSACNGQRKSMYGFIWVYENNYTENEYVNAPTVLDQPVNQYTYPDKQFIETYSSMHEVEQKTGISFKLVSRVCRGERMQTHGFIFEYAN